MTSRRTSRRAPRRASRRTPLLLTALALIVALLAACSGNPRSFSGGGGAGGGDAAAGGGGDKSISIAMVPGWDEDIAATYMWKALLEEKGYTVNVQELEIASTFTGLANDQIDLYLDAWLPSTHAAYWSRYESKLEALTTWSLGKNMLVVPQYVDVSSLDQLRAASAEFGGRIVGIEAGAGLMAATRTKVMPAYGLDNYTLVEGSSPAMLAALDSAIKGQEADRRHALAAALGVQRLPAQGARRPQAGVRRAGRHEGARAQRLQRAPAAGRRLPQEVHDEERAALLAHARAAQAGQGQGARRSQVVDRREPARRRRLAGRLLTTPLLTNTS